MSETGPGYEPKDDRITGSPARHEETGTVFDPETSADLIAAQEAARRATSQHRLEEGLAQDAAYQAEHGPMHAAGAEAARRVLREAQGEDPAAVEQLPHQLGPAAREAILRAMEEGKDKRAASTEKEKQS
jgi:hypothetical protein